MYRSEHTLIKIAIADDHQMVIDSLKEFILLNIVNCEIVCQAQNGQDLLDFLAKQSVDIILLDVSMPILDGINTLVELKLLKIKTKVIIVTMYNDLCTLSQLMKLEVDGIVLKSAPLSELKYAILQINQNRKFYSAKVTEKLLGKNINSTNINSLNHSFPVLDHLDKEILSLLCQGKTASETGIALYLSKRTIENRKQKMLQKLGFKNQASLITYAIKNGIYSD